MDNAENMVLDNVHQDKEAIASSFGKAADTYDKHAAFQRDVGHRLLEKLPSDLTNKRVDRKSVV